MVWFHTSERKENVNCKNFNRAVDTKFKLIKIPNFQSRVLKCGNKAGRRATNAHVHSWFPAVSTCKLFGVPSVTALISTFVFYSGRVPAANAPGCTAA